MILPEMDQDGTFFYQAEGPELRDKYKWYVNSLFTIGMSLRSLSEQAATTKEVLLAEYEKVRKIEEKKEAKRKNFTPRRKRTKTPKQTPLQVDQPEKTVEEETSDELSDAHAEAIAYLIHQCQGLADFFETTKSGYDEAHAIPFFTSYSEGEKPLPFAVSNDLLEGINTEPLSGLLSAEGVEEVLPTDLLNSLRQLLEKVSETEALHQDFTKRCKVEISPDHNVSVFYDTEATELKENFQWFPNTLYTLGLALDDCHTETTSVLAMLGVEEGAVEGDASNDSQNEPDLSQPILDDNQSLSTENEN
jgi:hypothetical protein